MQRRSIHIAGTLPMTRDRVIRLVSVSNLFSCCVLLEGENLTINGKSMLGLLSINWTTGRDFDLACDGEDEMDALDSLTRLLEEDR
jgi:phosphotransferase system HPr (HPr) family protein